MIDDKKVLEAYRKLFFTMPPLERTHIVNNMGDPLAKAILLKEWAEKITEEDEKELEEKLGESLP